MKTLTPPSDARQVAADRVEYLEARLRIYRKFADQVAEIERELAEAKAEFERILWAETEADGKK